MYDGSLRSPPGARRSISRVLSRPKGGDGHSSGTFVAERLARPTRAAARKTRPAAPALPTPPAAPTWSCSRWGLPCHRRCRRRGALLPHHFTLAFPSHPKKGIELGFWRYVFCGTFPRVAPAGRYPAPCLRGARTFLPPPKPASLGGERPSDRLAWDHVGNDAGESQVTARHIRRDTGTGPAAEGQPEQQPRQRQ